MAPPIAGRDPPITRRCTEMDALETYTSTITALSAALLLVAAGLAKQQLVWKRAKPVPARLGRRSCQRLMVLFERKLGGGRLR
jgi:hypothetical protein